MKVKKYDMEDGQMVEHPNIEKGKCKLKVFYHDRYFTFETTQHLDKSVVGDVWIPLITRILKEANAPYPEKKGGAND